MSQVEISHAAPTERAAYPLWTYDKIRFNDLDGQGHVNNAIFATYFEAGRVEYFRDRALALVTPDETCVLARMAIDFRAELHYPGTVDVGCRISAVGRTSFTMGQALFWVILLCGLVVMLSGVVPMTPVFGTRGQHLLYLTHRYSAIVLTIAVILHIPAYLGRSKAELGGKVD